MQWKNIQWKIVICLFFVLIYGCSTVPKEVVELSYRMGEDIEAVHKSYQKLIKDHFELLRNERLDYFINDWKPKYINGWIADGRLVDVAKGQIVWSPESKSFVIPIPGKENEGLLLTVEFWGNAAIRQIEKKQKSLIDPINNDETQLLAMVDEAFNRLYRGNSTITAHLNSLRKVQEVQDSALEGLKLKGMRDKIDDFLVLSSEKAQKGLDEIKNSDKALEDEHKNIEIRK